MALLVGVCALNASAGAYGPGSAPGANRVTISQPTKPIDDFELTDQHGKAFRLSQLRGAPALVFFGFTHCPDVCPATLAQLGLLMRSADKELHSTALVMVSVDGGRDNPETMRAYLAQALPQAIGLTGDPRTVSRIDAQFNGAFFKGLPDRPGGDYTVQHTSQVYLIDASGRLRATFFDTPIELIRQTTAAIALEKQP